ncbi:MAG: TIGR00730 family Rossman fold protein [Christensenellaceae bacterium]|nr:TIGR00730 family Rossman fold protein [Christensenellaceae bacterium]
MGKNICVYGASSTELDPKYSEAVYALGKEIALRGCGLVFGGGDKGLMGAVARGVHDSGGSIIGVAPSFFNVDGILYDECTEFIYTTTMRERKQIMEEKSDAFIAAPGGLGTFEELFEMLTLKQLGRHEKAIVIYNALGYYDPMLLMIEAAIEGRFAKDACRTLYKVTSDPKEALDYIENYKPSGLSVTELKNIAIDKEKN